MSEQWRPPNSNLIELSGELLVKSRRVSGLLRLVILVEFSTFRGTLGVWHFDFIESGNGFY